MHLRFSSARGMPVVEDETHAVLGVIDDILIHPDTGQVLGFFVRAPEGMFSSVVLFLHSFDILSWGTRVHLQSGDRLVPPEDVVRIAPLLSQHRPVLGQRVVTEKRRSRLGTCRDVQFSSRTFLLEWIFPRTLFFWGTPIPAQEIVRVTPQAVVVHEPLRPKREIQKAKEADGSVPAIPEVLPAVSMQGGNERRSP